MNKKAVVNNETCIACSACVFVCPVEAISIDEFAIIDQEKCTGCGNCIGRCPVDAIVLS